MIKLNFILCAVVLAICASGSAYAFPLVPESLSSAQLEMLRLASPAVNYQGIVKLNNCSGALVRFANSVDTDPAMVLTNGHCLGGFLKLGFLKPGEVRVNVPVTRSFKLLSDDGQSSKGYVKANRVIVATMTKTDITLYGLTQTFAQIAKNYSVKALTISPNHPLVKTPITVISGYFSTAYSCQIDAFIYDLHEADWDMRDSMRYSTPGCETIHGTSGSPVINQATNEIIGINNTGNDNGERCTMDNPCEIDEHGNVTVILHASYAQQTYVLYSCLNQQRQFDLTLPSCVLRP